MPPERTNSGYFLTMSSLQEASIREYIRKTTTTTENDATRTKSRLQFHNRASQSTCGKPISPALPGPGISDIYSQKSIPSDDLLLDEFLIEQLKDNMFSTQDASLNSVTLQGGKLSRRPDTPIPISRNSTISDGLSLDALRLPLSISSNQLPQEEEKQSPQFPSRNSTPSKRRRTAGLSDDLYDLDEDRDQSPNDSIKKFACPYFRKDPERHLECINLKMIRISDVKQHLKRRHTVPYACPICSEGFSSLNLQQEHIMQQTCSQGSGANLDSVSLTSQRSLQARFAKGLSPEAQWYGIWKILFGAPRGTMPKPYLDGVVKEVIGILREKWLDEGKRRISEFVQAQDQPPSYNDQLCQLLAGILDGVEASFEQKASDRSSRKPPVDLGRGPEESTGAQLDTTFDPITTGEYSFPTDGGGDWFTSYDTAILSFDFSAAQSEVSELSYQESELKFPGALLLQAQSSYPDKPVLDHDLWDHSQQQHDSMGGAML